MPPGDPPSPEERGSETRAEHGRGYWGETFLKKSGRFVQLSAHSDINSLVSRNSNLGVDVFEFPNTRYPKTGQLDIDILYCAIRIIVGKENDTARAATCRGMEAAFSFLGTCFFARWRPAVMHTRPTTSHRWHKTPI